MEYTSIVLIVLLTLLTIVLVIVIVLSSTTWNKSSEGTTYTIFGAGPSGLYTIWRLMSSGKITSQDTIDLYEWGNYDFTGQGTRAPAGRICTHYYNNDRTNSHVEIGGMRYMHWNGHPNGAGQRLITRTIDQLDLEVVDFLVTDNPLYYLRGKHFYANDIKEGRVKAPYNTPENTKLPYDVYADVSSDIIGDNVPDTRAKQCKYYADGKFGKNFKSQIYSKTETVSNTGYWNVFYDQVGNEAYNYANAGGGYDSNLINWNTADASIYNSDFTPGGTFKTVAGGFSNIFVKMYSEIINMAKEKNITFHYHPGRRLHSIWLENDKTMFNIASADDPDQAIETKSSDIVFLAMPRHSIELVAVATKYLLKNNAKNYFLNKLEITNYIESVIKQPSSKMAMFFDRPWWKDAPFKPKLVDNGSTKNVFGPSVTDLPIRQVYYFGDNASIKRGVYGVLTSYNDIMNVDFWRTMELGDIRRTAPAPSDVQPLQGGRKAPPEMEKMILKQLTELHFGSNSKNSIPRPLETVFMDWFLDPFGAGYHAWEAHFNIVDVMNKIRTPAGSNKHIYIIGSAYSNDQAWIEGAFCTAESVLTEFLGLEPLIDTANYPLIC